MLRSQTFPIPSHVTSTQVFHSFQLIVRHQVTMYAMYTMGCLTANEHSRLIIIGLNFPCSLSPLKIQFSYSSHSEMSMPTAELKRLGRLKKKKKKK